DSVKLPSPDELAVIRRKEDVWDELFARALIITSNFPWRPIIGLLQRLYQPYFKTTTMRRLTFGTRFHLIRYFTRQASPIEDTWACGGHPI
ncbi:hypothetical protein OSTOST_05862, partial [Ostertagia ostertagi]